MADYTAAASAWNLDEEGDLCRVCRTEAEDTKPLIYPCKCSGSVRYVHSDCLQEWLSHSRKRYCEICGHHYTFTKVYPSSLPSAIPVAVYARQSLLVAGRTAWRVFRAWIAILSWLVILPCVTMSSLRLILVGADYITFPALAYGARNAITDSWADLNATYAAANLTAEVLNNNPNITGRERVLAVIAQNGTLNHILPTLTERMSHDAKNLVAFVFRGQIIAICIAAGLIGLILLREWIGQIDWHARPPPHIEEPIRQEEWVFRNGQALPRLGYHTLPEGFHTLTDPATAVPDADGQVADGELADGAPADEGHPPVLQRPPLDMDFILPPFDPPERDDDMKSTNAEYDPEEGEQDFSGDTIARARPSPSHVAYAAPELLGGEESSSRAFLLWEDNAEAGPSRAAADVPSDALSASPSPVQAPPSWASRSVATDDERSRSGSYLAGDESPRGHFYSPPEAGILQALDTIPSTSGAPDNSPDLRRASDPGPFNGELHVERAGERQFGSQGLPYGPGDSPPVDVGAEENGDPGLLLDDTPPVNRHEDAFATPIAPLRAELIRVDTDLEDLDTDADAEGDAEGDGDVADVDAEQEEEDEANAVVEAVMGPQRGADPLDPLDGMGMEVAPEDDDDRPLDAEDWDGIFEVIGFIGPLTGLLHNHVFVSIAMACTLTLLIGLPIVVGKLVLSTDMVRSGGDLSLMLIRTTGLLFGLTVDLGVLILREVFALPRLLIKPALTWLTTRLNLPALEFNATAPNITSTLLQLSAASDRLLTADLTTELPPGVGTAANSVLSGFEVLGHYAYKLYKAWHLFAISVAASPDANDQIWCLAVGYVSITFTIIVIALADAAKLFELSDLFVERARNVQIFFKVVFFMTLEIVVFPLFVGIIIDLCLLPVFGWTLQDQLTQLSGRPFGTLFVAWLTGTLFMFSFATFLAHMRTVCRHGALYFIRDPSDPSHSPVKDIMERPALAQIPRLAVSAAMYAIVVFAVCGAVPLFLAGLKRIGLFKTFLPLRLEQRPLSSVPFDLLFLHLILPPSWDSLRIFHRLKKGLAYWWTFTVRTLNLSSLIFGTQPQQKPESKEVQLFWLVTDAFCQAVFGPYDNRATPARVPASDRVELLPITDRRREGMLIALDHTGAPRTVADRIRLLKQDRAARNAGRDPRRDYTVIQLPDYWRTRVYALLFLALLTSSFVVGSLVFVPLAVGRLATRLLFARSVFDGYSWLFGGYICWGSYSLGQTTKKRIIQWSRARRLRRSKASTRFKRGVFSALKNAYSVILLYLVVPLLVGINFELFIALPVRYGFSRDVTPVLHFWDAWAMGTAFISVYVGAVGMVNEHPIAGIEGGRHRGQRFREAFKKPLSQRFRELNDFILPLVGTLIIPIVAPWALFLALHAFLATLGLVSSVVRNGWPFRMMYPLTSAGFVLFTSRRAITKTADRVRQWMIDAEYVVEERVENYEPSADGPLDNDSTVVEPDHDLIVEGEWEDVPMAAVL